MASWSHQVEYINNLHEDNELCFSHMLSEAFGKHLQAFSKHIQRRQWQPTPVLLPGKSHGWRSLVGCSLWGRTESDVTEATSQQQEQTHTKSAKGIKRYTSFSSQCFSMFNLS